MEDLKDTMGTQNKMKSNKISNIGLPFRRYSVPETVMRKYSLKRQRSVQSPIEFGLPGTRDQGCQTGHSLFSEVDVTQVASIFRAKENSSVKFQLPVTKERAMRCSRCHRASERRHSYSCKYNLLCSKCKHSWRKTSLPASIVSLSKTCEYRIEDKPTLFSESSPENKIQFDIGKIIERTSENDSDLSKDVDLTQSFAPETTLVNLVLDNEESNVEENTECSEKEDRKEVVQSDLLNDKTSNQTFEERILKLLDTYCPHMQCTLNMFMGTKRPHSEGSQRSLTSSDVKRPKSANGRLAESYKPASCLDNSRLDSPVTDRLIDNQINEIISNINSENLLNFGDDRGVTQNILIIEHDNTSSTENTPGSTTRECESCQDNSPKCCSQEFSDTQQTISCCCTSPDTTIEMKTSSGLTSSSGTLDQTVSDRSASTQDSTLSVTSATPEDKSRLKSISPIPVVLSSESIIINPIIPDQEGSDTADSSQIEETKIETKNEPFPTVINTETTLIEPLERGYVSKKDMHNYDVRFLDSGTSDSSEEVKKNQSRKEEKLIENYETTSEASKITVNGKTPSEINHDQTISEKNILKIDQPSRSRRASFSINENVTSNDVPEVPLSNLEQTYICVPNQLKTTEQRPDEQANGISSSEVLPQSHSTPSFCGVDKVNYGINGHVTKDTTEVLYLPSNYQNNMGLDEYQQAKQNSYGKIDSSTQSHFSENFPSNLREDKTAEPAHQKKGSDKMKLKREKREAKLAELSDFNVSEFEGNPLSIISTSNYQEGSQNDFLIPRYSATPRTVSMFVNTSSEYSSDSELSFADSLEDRLSPIPDRISGDYNRFDNRLVRGEVAEIQMINDCKHKRRLKDCYAYFVTLSGEETTISVTTMPEALRNRLIMREKQIKYLCRHRHSGKKTHCKKSTHKVCSKHKFKQKQTQTSPQNLGNQSEPKSKSMDKSVQTCSNKVEIKTNDQGQDDRIQNYEHIMIGFSTNSVETSIYYKQDISSVSNLPKIKDEISLKRTKSHSVQNGSIPPKSSNSGRKDQSNRLEGDIDVDRQICEILLAGLKDQERGQMVFVEETKQVCINKAKISTISTSVQTVDGVKDSSTLTDLSYDCQKRDKVLNKAADQRNKKKLSALQKSEEAVEKLQKINENLRKEIQETKITYSQGTQVNFDPPKKERDSNSNSNSYNSLLNHTNNFKQTSFAEYRRVRGTEPAKNSSRQSLMAKTNVKPPVKVTSKRSNNILGTKFRQKFEAIPEEKSNGSFESTEDSTENTPRKKSSDNIVVLGSTDKHFNVNGNVNICRSANDCRLNNNEIYYNERRHTVGNLMFSDPDDVNIMEQSAERRRNTIHGNLSVSNTETLLNSEHLKKSTGNLNVNVSRRSGQIIGKRTSMMVGRFERVNEQVTNGDGAKLSHFETYKGRAALETDEQEELLTLSRGWINFYLLRGDSQEVTSENGIHEEVFGQARNGSPSDIVDQQMGSATTVTMGNPKDEPIGQYTVHIHAEPESAKLGTKFPGLTLTSSNKSINIQPDDIILPEINSPPQSSPSSAFSRSPVQAKTDPQVLPSLPLSLKGVRKSRTSDDLPNFRKEKHIAPSKYSVNLTPPNSPKAMLDRSGDFAYSEQSITSSSCGSESPKFLTEKNWNSHRHKRNLSTSANSWTVTVAGNQEANDVEMKLAFSHTQQDRQRRSYGSSNHQWTLTVNSGKREKIREKPRNETFQCLPDLNIHDQMHRKGWKWKEQPAAPPSSEQLSLLWPAVQEIIEKNILLQNSARLDPTWNPEKTEEVRSNLSVTGWAITPEKKPRVPTQSERDLTRIHHPRAYKHHRLHCWETLSENRESPFNYTDAKITQESKIRCVYVREVAVFLLAYKKLESRLPNERKGVNE